MPEIAVNEHRDSTSEKGDIGPSEHLDVATITAPALPKVFPKQPFSKVVASAHGAHVAPDYPWVSGPIVGEACHE
jgi:hypothetical protein